MTRLRFWIGIAVSALCVYLVARRISWPAVAAAIAGVRPAWLIAGMFGIALSYVVNGFRWRHVISKEAPLSARDAYDVVAIGNLANLVAPSRAGDLAKSALVARWKSVPVSRILGGVAVERFADVVMLIFLALALWSSVRFPPVVEAGVLVLAGAGVVSVLAVIVAADRLPRIVERVIAVVSPSFAVRIAGFVEGVFIGVRSAARPDLAAGTLALSAAIWAVSAAAVLCMMRAFELPVPWYAAFFVLLVVNLGGVIPSSPGSIGVYHYLTLLALTVWMSDTDRALGYAVVAHAAGLTVVTMQGLVALVHRHESLWKLTA